MVAGGLDRVPEPSTCWAKIRWALHLVAFALGGCLGWIATAVFFRLAKDDDVLVNDQGFLLYCAFGATLAFGFHFPFLIFRVVRFKLKRESRDRQAKALIAALWFASVATGTVVIVYCVRLELWALKTAAYTTLLSFCFAVIDGCIWTQVADLFQEARARRHVRHRSEAIMRERSRLMLERQLTRAARATSPSGASIVDIDNDRARGEEDEEDEEEEEEDEDNGEVDDEVVIDINRET